MARLSLLGVALGALGVCGLLAMTNCAEPTQIVVEVFTDACPATGKPEVIHSTGIAVGTAENIESRRPSSTREGCETATGVGTLIIYPSGDKDDEVAIKVLGGVERTPDRCDPPGYAGCIVHRRMLRFIPNVTQRATVRLSLACLNRQCQPGTTCDNGACVGERDVRNDGTTNPGAERIESGIVPPVDGGLPDAADPLCAGCKGTCAGGICTVDCSKVSCVGQLCAPTLACDIRCPKTGTCNDIACTTTGKCTIDCGKEVSSCKKVACKADDCDVTCDGRDSCNVDANLSLIATTRARLDCDGDNACRTAKLYCESKDCDLACDPGGGPNDACPNRPLSPATCVSSLTTGCAGWFNPSSN
jgi:hypothetical protein